MLIDLPKNVNLILDTLNNNGYAAYVVGGCVRDSILNIEPKDWDITTSATPAEVKNIFDYFSNIKTIMTGERYGTVSIIIDNVAYECTTFRCESTYTDGRRPDIIIFENNLLADLQRRDFTCNAIAYSKLTGLIDPYYGQYDIKNKMLRCVGNPLDRFKEDNLRILRAFRFALTYNFVLDYDMRQILYSINFTKALDCLSKERVRDELIKILNNVDIKKINLLKNQPFPDSYTLFNKLCQVIFNKTLYSVNTNIKRTGKDIDRYKLLLAMFLNSTCCIDTKLYNPEIWLRKYKFSNNDITNILNIIKLMNIVDFNKKITDIKMRQLLKIFTYDELSSFFAFYGKKKLINRLNKNLIYPTTVKQLAVNGTDLIALGYIERHIGYILNKLLDIVIIKPELNTKEILLKIVKEK